MPTPLAFPPPAPLPMIGGRSLVPSSGVAGYEIVRRLGISATSEVVLAIARGPFGFERTVVLKRLLLEIAEGDDVGANARLGREALAYARLAHDAIVRLYDFVEEPGTRRLTLVLEHVDGLSLARVVSGLRTNADTLDDGVIWYLGQRIFMALAAAHSARDPMTRELGAIIHRDVCPGNVLVGWDGSVKLSDFGVARLAGVPSDTRPGVVKGTFGYLAPEQVRGEAPTVRTDVYGACLVMRELLLRAPVFPREHRSEMDLLAAMERPELVPLAALRPNLPMHLTNAIDRGLAPDPEARGVTAEEMVSLMRSVVDVEAARARLADRIAQLRRYEDASPRSSAFATRPDGDTQRAVTSRPPAPAADRAAPTPRRSLSPLSAVATRPPPPPPFPRRTPFPPPTSMVVPRAQSYPSSPEHRSMSPYPSAILAISPPPSSPATLPLPARLPPAPPRQGFASRTSSAMIFETPNVMTTPVFAEPSPRSKRARPSRAPLLLVAAALAIGSGIGIGGLLGWREKTARQDEKLPARAVAIAPPKTTALASVPSSNAPRLRLRLRLRFRFRFRSRSRFAHDRPPPHLRLRIRPPPLPRLPLRRPGGHPAHRPLRSPRRTCR